MRDYRIGYMDEVDYLYELGSAMYGNTIHPSVKDLKRTHPCVEECGIVKVKVSVMEQIQPSNFSAESGVRGSELDEYYASEEFKLKTLERIKYHKECLAYLESRLKEKGHDIS